MPPKKQGKGNKEGIDRKKMKEITKVAEDKAFGMKNKNKSKVVQKTIKGLVSHNTKGGVDKFICDEFIQRQEQKKIDDERKFMASIKLGDIHSMAKLKEDLTVDPKSVLCPYFKAGLCQKGKRCKYSHDMEVENKCAKINIYVDQRDNETGGDDMRNWDQKKLEEAVNFNENKYSKANQTDKICDNFLQAVNDSKYGWFWVCPNGLNCKYRHCLPPGYVLKVKGDGRDEKEEFNVERDIDEMRQKLGSKGTPVTYELFMEWRERRKVRKEKELEEKKKTDMKSKGIKVAKNKKIMSGKALFVFDPTLFQDAEDAVGKKDLEDEDAMETNGVTDKDLGGKKWDEVKKVEKVVEENEEEDENIIKEEKEEEKEEDIDADVFADEEDLPDDL